MSIEIEELTKLVEEEKAAEKKIEQARHNAEETVKRAREEANKIITEAQNSSDSQARLSKEFEEKKDEVEKGHQQRINSLNRQAENNFERAVKRIVEDVMRVKS